MKLWFLGVSPLGPVISSNESLSFPGRLVRREEHALPNVHHLLHDVHCEGEGLARSQDLNLAGIRL